MPQPIIRQFAQQSQATNRDDRLNSVRAWQHNKLNAIHKDIQDTRRKMRMSRK